VKNNSFMLEIIGSSGLRDTPVSLSADQLASFTSLRLIAMRVSETNLASRLKPRKFSSNSTNKHCSPSVLLRFCRYLRECNSGSADSAATLLDN